MSSTQPIHMAQLTFSWLDSVPIGTVTVSLVVAVIEPAKLNVFWSTLTKTFDFFFVSSPCFMVYIHSLHYESNYSIPIKVCKLYVIPMISLG